MSIKTSLFLALGAGLAFYSVLTRRRRQRSAWEWTGKETQARPGTALITGASSGIGEAIARLLARQGYHLVLLARREARLRALADELARQSHIEAEVLAADLSDPDDLERAVRFIRGLPALDLLVNNAGFGLPGHFAEADPQREVDMLRVHIEAAVRLARAALPGMIARGHGGIINVASIAGLLALPEEVMYGSTKGYLVFFSEALNAELAGTGVRVEALCPGFTYSEFHDDLGIDRSTIPGFMWSHVGEVVEAGWKGLREGRAVVIPGALNRLLAWMMRLPLVAPLARQAQGWRQIRQWHGQAGYRTALPPES